MWIAGYSRNNPMVLVATEATVWPLGAVVEGVQVSNSYAWNQRMDTYMHTYIHTHIHTHTRTYTHSHSHTYTKAKMIEFNPFVHFFFPELSRDWKMVSFNFSNRVSGSTFQFHSGRKSRKNFDEPKKTLEFSISIKKFFLILLHWLFEPRSMFI